MQIRTWMVETTVVATILITTTILTGSRFVEWIGTLAVIFTFGHASIANRMMEKQAQMIKPDVDCYQWNDHYFLLKEILWFAYFIINQSYAALVGVMVFLVYPFWRKFYRRKMKTQDIKNSA